MAGAMIGQKKLFRPDEVADLLQVATRTVYRMSRDGRLPGVDLKQSPRRIPREALMKVMENEPEY
jgi:excisionase family DNA binding protein